MNIVELQSKSERVERVLREVRSDLAPVVDVSLEPPEAALLDFSGNQEALSANNIRDTILLSRFVRESLDAANATVGLGGYLENRSWYARSGVFCAGEEVRTVHLGVDIWTAVGAVVRAPLAGRVHSFQDNHSFGDYGPTIILEHEVDTVRFYTLFGHLSRQSLAELELGQVIARGQEVARLGAPPINGDWPPHLHFQIITDMGGREGDFPGVAARSQVREYALLCPNPALLIRSSLLPLSAGVEAKAA
jgi:murein DD-endopeptidase MepM/ murein hydrolase activator NlpD